MDVLRKGFDGVYDLIKPGVFWATRKNPEVAHGMFVGSLRGLRRVGLSGLVLDNSSNLMGPDCMISNGAGFNKNAEINPKDMEYLGFDRVVVGTVTYDSWNGNPKPRIERFVESGSLVNWMGLPGVGACEVARRLCKYGEHGVPLTINLMATPEKNGKGSLLDLGHTVLMFRDVPYVDRFELNVSCPNTHGDDGKIDVRDRYVEQLDGMLDVMEGCISCNQDLYLKVSPDLNKFGVDEIVEVCEGHRVSGYVIGNTTTDHLPEYIAKSPGKGGASGNAVWDASRRVQEYFAERVGRSKLLIACGGINSFERMRKRCAIGKCSEVQVFTGLIFRGPRLLRELRNGDSFIN
jgi:dihydroorotate dehydrogenase